MDPAPSVNHQRRARDNHFVARHAHWWLGLMLLALHAAIAWGLEAPWATALLLLHFGLFLLWQPLWHGAAQVEPRQAFLVIIVALLLSVVNSGWLVALWLTVLTSLIGGGVPGIAGGRQRVASLLAALYLLSLLLMWVVPQLSARTSAEPGMSALVRYGLPIVPAVILVLRMDPPRVVTRMAVDLFYSVMLFLLVAALVLGSFVILQVNQGQYGVALAQSLMVIALVLIGLSWLWGPTAGFAGIEQLLSRYLLSVGLPFELWVQQLAALAERDIAPRQFLDGALEHMLALPWIIGLHWETRTGAGRHGRLDTPGVAFSQGDLRLRIHTRWTLSPAMLLHLKLLVQMVGHFYAAKEREQLQRQNAYTQAIYETGSRLTHDVKNLLQSLRSLCAAAEGSAPEQAQALQALMQRQLPQITQRLNTTLDKLRAPEPAATTRTRADAWWAALLQRHAHRPVTFALEGDLAAHELPAELFDSVADNLIENALRKNNQAGADGNALAVGVTFAPATSDLQVADAGDAIAAALAAQLFTAPVASRAGLGVGLYHAAGHATQAGYALTLAVNQHRHVRFRLLPAPLHTQDKNHL